MPTGSTSLNLSLRKPVSASRRAQKRGDDVIAQARSAQTEIVQALDAARKAAAQFAFFTAFSLVIGAFVGAAAGAFGGRQRDYV
jgi:hypothetical protein